MAENKRYITRKFGPKTERRDYSVTKQTLELTDILSTSKESFDNFMKKEFKKYYLKLIRLQLVLLSLIMLRILSILNILLRKSLVKLKK
nr:hypothetical protein [Mycoplasmopsis cynos]